MSWHLSHTPPQDGTLLEDACICHQQPCGFIDDPDCDPDCPEHGTGTLYHSRGHHSSDCPGFEGRVTPIMDAEDPPRPTGAASPRGASAPALGGTVSRATG